MRQIELDAFMEQQARENPHVRGAGQSARLCALLCPLAGQLHGRWRSRRRNAQDMSMKTLAQPQLAISAPEPEPAQTSASSSGSRRPALFAALEAQGQTFYQVQQSHLRKVPKQVWLCIADSGITLFDDDAKPVGSSFLFKDMVSWSDGAPEPPSLLLLLLLLLLVSHFQLSRSLLHVLHVQTGALGDRVILRFEASKHKQKKIELPSDQVHPYRI
jgi:hypothetical protein